MSLPDIKTCEIAVIGLGYVGLPLAVEFAKTDLNNKKSKLSERKVIGFDINNRRISELKNNFDKTDEISKKVLENLNIKFTSNQKDLVSADVFIITVPTPIEVLIWIAIITIPYDVAVCIYFLYALPLA